MLKEEVLNNFYRLSGYLEKEGIINDLNNYRKDISAFLWHADHLKAYEFVTPFCMNKKVLDVGCFIGIGEEILASSAKEIIAIDADDKALEFARHNTLAPNVRFEKIDARDLPFPNETFHIAIAFHLIEHIPPKEVKIFLHEIKRVLKNDGILFITTPNRKFRLRFLQPPYNLEHYQEFTAKKLLKILQAIFDDVEINGISANDWIKEIERKRVRKSLYKAYIRIPIARLINRFFPNKINKLIKKCRTGKTKSFQAADNNVEQKNEFDKLFQQLSMDEVFLKNLDLDQSIELLAICKKFNP